MSDMHVGLRWMLTKEQLENLEKIIIEKHGKYLKKIKACNLHGEQKGDYCSRCGVNLQEKFEERNKEDFEWWIVFDEEGYYMGGDNTIYLPMEGGCSSVSLNYLQDLDVQHDDLIDLLDSFNKHEKCVFSVPEIYEIDSED